MIDPRSRIMCQYITREGLDPGHWPQDRSIIKSRCRKCNYYIQWGYNPIHGDMRWVGPGTMTISELP